MKHLLQELAMIQAAAQARRCLCCRRKLVQPLPHLQQLLQLHLQLCLSMAVQACTGMQRQLAMRVAAVAS